MVALIAWWFGGEHVEEDDADVEYGTELEWLLVPAGVDAVSELLPLFLLLLS